ncbi:1-aminocyclopropane-1-carboxylate deaminase/D-cysteine desulfhydrase [Pedobacter sp. SD-b]|uniref:1-aminocyclopropane-1-carboxylate deaminase/D-cysteine desulfhydrase n=1 Tax=Pedobacter segetis TaxID=2793069 RepID=A0ABS1BMB4_9SPHI|nr:pyridoxal-phosphate dependent enzyme [Pedobacter segetis]MBK0384030.1 1-aminocyclopropane-1-carboxylate deaminase/D-cysteine desulfhydrase [Pedobacter segetis]
MIDLKFVSREEEINYPPITDHVKLFIKRDDTIHPFISGNKWRKLKYNLIDAKEKQKTHLVTFGGAFSNHLLATAAAGAKFGLKTTAFVRGEKVNNPVLDLCQLFGMNLIFITRKDYKDKPRLFKSYFDEDNECFLLDEGGYGLNAEKGCREIITELKNGYDHIFCSAGTGATAAGIINQVFISKLNTKVNIVPALKGGEFLKPEIDNLLIDKIDYQLHTHWHFGGYAKTKPELINFIKDFTQKTGILIDPVYTSKTLYAIKDLVSKNHFKKDDKILMIHTGGLFGILGMMDKLV